MFVSKFDIQKNRTEAGGINVVRILEKYSTEDILTEIFIITENCMVKKLLTMYETLILSAKINPKKYLKDRHQNLIRISKFILTNSLLREWVNFTYFILISLTETAKGIEDKNKVISAYHTELMDTWNYLTDLDSYLCGLDSQGIAIKRPTIFPHYDKEIIYYKKLWQEKKISKEIFGKKLMEHEAKYGAIYSNESVIDIACYHALPFINEKTIKIHPDRWFNHAFAVDLKLPREWKNTEFYKDLLKKRKFFLNRNGITVKLKNAGDFTEILFLEDFTENGFVMLFKLSTKDGSTQGYYNFKYDHFFTAFKHSSNGRELHAKIQNLILEIYTDIIVGFEKDKKKAYALQFVDNLDNINVFNSQALYAQIDISEPNTTSKERGTMKEKAFHEVKGFIRKVRGSASDEAVNYAKEYGIELPTGFTFVRPHERGTKNREE